MANLKHVSPVVAPRPHNPYVGSSSLSTATNPLGVKELGTLSEGVPAVVQPRRHLVDSLGRRVYGPYLAIASSKRPGKSKIRRHVILTFGPHFSQRKNTSYARWLMEHSLGRELTPAETVDHDDENTLNDSLDNFNIMSHADNCRKHVAKRGANGLVWQPLIKGLQ